MDDRRAAEGIEHLQAAAHELVAAARVFLDAVEEVIDEPERLKQSFSGVVDMVKDLAGRPVQPWEAHAWTQQSTDFGSDIGTRTRPDGDNESDSTPGSDNGEQVAASDGEAAADATVVDIRTQTRKAAVSDAANTAGTPKAREPRVKRISVE